MKLKIENFIDKKNKKPDNINVNYLSPEYNFSVNIDSSINDIANFIFDHNQRQPYRAKFPKLMANTKNSFLLRNPDDHKIEKLNDGKIEREANGAQHASRVAITSIILLNLVTQHSDFIKSQIDKIITNIQNATGWNENLSRENFIKLLQIAALYANAERNGEGEDRKEWHEKSSAACFKFLRKLEVPTEIAKLFADAIFFQDAPLTNQALFKKFKCSNNAELILHLNTPANKTLKQAYFPDLGDRYIDENILNNYIKNPLSVLIQSAVSLDGQREKTIKHIGKNLTSRYILKPKTKHVKLNDLNLWQYAMDGIIDGRPIIPQENCLQLQRELLELSLHYRDTIKSQSDLKNPCPIEVELNGKKIRFSEGIKTQYNESDRRKFEHGGQAFNQTAGNFQLDNNPFLKKLYNGGQIISVKAQAEDKDIEKENGIIIDFLYPLEQAINKKITQLNERSEKPNLDDFTLSLINLKYQLKSEITQRFAKEIQKQTLTIENINATEFANVPDEMLALTTENITLPDELDKETKKANLNKLNEHKENLQPLLRNNRSLLAGAVAFVLFAGLGAILGGLGYAATYALAGYALGNIPLAAAGGLMGLIQGGTKGFILGGCIAVSIVGPAAVNAGIVFWKHKHAGLRDPIHRTLDLQKKEITSKKPSAPFSEESVPSFEDMGPNMI